jgi:hypothetical protein
MKKDKKPVKLGSKYTDEHIAFIRKCRDEAGADWPTTASAFKDEFPSFKGKVSSEGLRIVYKNLKDRDPATEGKRSGIDFTPRDSKMKRGKKLPWPDTRSILVISDQHIPYEHPDMFDFLQAIKEKHQPTLVVNIGDEVDKHALSFHDSDADLPSAGEELKQSIIKLKRMEKMFPEMTIVDSNHGSLALRKFKHHGIPMKYLATQHQIYGVSEKWQWVNSLSVTLPNGQDCYFCHGMVKNGIKLAAQRGTNVVQGHYHTEFKIEYIGNPSNLLFSLQVGCLIDTHSMAFAYDKLNLNRPIIGVGMVVDSKPMLIPMVLNENGRWIGKL